jgi:hypothetical protein
MSGRCGTADDIDAESVVIYTGNVDCDALLSYHKGSEGMYQQYIALRQQNRQQDLYCFDSKTIVLQLSD